MPSKTVYDFVTFDADFPDDAEWDEHGNNLVPEGRSIADTIKNKLQESGMSCSDVVQHSFYGWAFDTVSDKSTVWCLLGAGDGWSLLLEQRDSIFRRLVAHRDLSAFGEVQNSVHHILTGDKRFSKVLWYTKSDYEDNRKDRARRTPL